MSVSLRHLLDRLRYILESFEDKHPDVYLIGLTVLAVLAVILWMWCFVAMMVYG
jgi:hypothetical protein